MYNAFSTYSSPYITPVTAGLQYGQPPKQEIVKVNGENGARAYQMSGPNSSALLLDETQPVIWLKQTDGAGYPTLSAYKIEPYSPEPVTQSELEKRIKRLEGIINESYINDVKQSRSGKSPEPNKSNQEYAERQKSR